MTIEVGSASASLKDGEHRSRSGENGGEAFAEIWLSVVNLVEHRHQHSRVPRDYAGDDPCSTAELSE